MSKYWSDFVRGLVPYVPGEQPKSGASGVAKLIKLNTNENPYGPSPLVLSAIQDELDERLRRYPDPDAGTLLSAAAAYYGVPEDYVFAGNGSDEILAHTFMALFRHEQPILFPDISYSFYPVYCALYDIQYRTVPLDQNFQLRLADYAQPNGGIIFPNPNAPTGVALELAAIEQLLEQNRESVVVIDEAYVDFGAQSAVQLTRRYPQLLVTHTLSKSRSLAGLRVGLAIGDPALIEGLRRVKDSFNSYPLDRLAIVGGAAAFRDRDYFEHTRRKVMEQRDLLVEELRALGFQVLPSAANFVFARHPRWPGEKLTQTLRERAILVRHFKAPRIQDYLRISVGLPEENSALLAALRDMV
jgi:histidinol-phosphate aminotransferase